MNVTICATMSMDGTVVPTDACANVRQRTTEKNQETIARARIARYLIRQARSLGLSNAQLAKVIHTSPDRIGKMKRVTPQWHVLQRLGTRIEEIALSRRAAARG